MARRDGPKEPKYFKWFKTYFEEHSNASVADSINTFKRTLYNEPAAKNPDTSWLTNIATQAFNSIWRNS